MKLKQSSRTLSMRPVGADYIIYFCIDLIAAMLVSDEMIKTGHEYSSVDLNKKLKIATKLLPEYDRKLLESHTSSVPSDLYLRFGNEIGLICPNGGPRCDSKIEQGKEPTYGQCTVFYSTEESFPVPLSYKEESIGPLTVDVTPNITGAGKQLYATKLKHLNETFGQRLFEQLIRVEQPNPDWEHKDSVKDEFYVRPFLELTRLIHQMNGLSREELMIYGLQLTDYRKFETIKSKIQDFRAKLKHKQGQYDEFVQECFDKEMSALYDSEIRAQVRKKATPYNLVKADFISKLLDKMKIYAESYYRLLRYTQMFVSDGYVIKVDPYFRLDIFTLLYGAKEEQKARGCDCDSNDTNDKQEGTDAQKDRADIRIPAHVNDSAYSYLVDLRAWPSVWHSFLGYEEADDFRIPLQEYMASCFRMSIVYLREFTLSELVHERLKLIAQDNEAYIQRLSSKAVNFSIYQDVIDTYKDVLEQRLFDCPLYSVWNTYRAMLMLGIGSITCNITLDSNHFPISATDYRVPHVDCVFKEFRLSIGAILRTGNAQFKADAFTYNYVFERFATKGTRQSVTTYCLYLTPTINKNTLNYCREYNKVNEDESIKLIPMSFIHFMQLLMNAKNSTKRLIERDLKLFLEACAQNLQNALYIKTWDSMVQKLCSSWLAQKNGHEAWPEHLTAELRKGRPKR